MPTTSIPTDPQEVAALLAELRRLAAAATTEGEVRRVTARIASITRAYRIKHKIGIPTTLARQAVELNPGYRVRPHLQYLSDRISAAVSDVENGQSRMLAVSMPPRAGKSTLLSLYGPVWLLRRHPEWKIITAAYDGGLTADWAKQARELIEHRPQLGIALAADGGAGWHWGTQEGGGLRATSVRGGLIGRGAKVMIIDDPVKDFVDAHSSNARQALWDWWLSVAQTRLEQPYLVIVVMTRWHEDDFIGRLFSDESEGDPAQWERISLPAVADAPDDVLQRAEGEPLYSPLVDETRNEALDRWADVRRSVGTYTFSAMYQQHPSSPKGSIFDTSWWKFWSMDQNRATEDGRVVYLDPSSLVHGKWLDSWDCNFDKLDESAGSWVVGQRWVRNQANRYLIAQQRDRWTFTQTLKHMEQWSESSDWARSPCGSLVHQRLIEKKANGAAIIDVLKDKISGLKPINPTESKEARARAVTPEVESGNVYLPHPSDPGNEWVHEFLTEVRDFPNGLADDQVDSMTQALSGLRLRGVGKATVPRGPARVVNIAQAAASDRNRYRR